MYFIEVILLVATLNAANSAVVVNIYNEAESDKKIQVCDNIICNHMCVKKGYILGECIEDQCMCEAFKRASAEKIDDTYKLELSSCDTNDCSAICQALGYPHGSCDGNICKCSRLAGGTDHPLHSCNNVNCDQTCRRLGFVGGVCVGDRCKCDNFVQSRVSEMDASYKLELRTCNNDGCSAICRALGYPHGTCDGNICECSNIAEDEKEIPVLKIVRDLSNKDLTECNLFLCELACKQVLTSETRCDTSRCDCQQATGTYDKLCDEVACSDACGRLNYLGRCTGSTCECI